MLFRWRLEIGTKRGYFAVKKPITRNFLLMKPIVQIVLSMSKQSKTTPNAPNIQFLSVCIRGAGWSLILGVSHKSFCFDLKETNHKRRSFLESWNLEYFPYPNDAGSVYAMLCCQQQCNMEVFYPICEDFIHIERAHF